MAEPTHSYSFTYEAYAGDVVTGSAEVQVKYTFRPGVAARIHYDEHDHPAEGPEIDIVDVVVEDWPGPVWRTATKDEFERFSDAALDGHFDAMVDEALDDREAAEDEAREHAAEMRAENLRWIRDPDHG